MVTEQHIAGISRHASNAKPGNRAAIYARQSRASRSSYTSCEAQIAICRDLATERGWRVPEIFSDEGQSSETLDRPELQRLLTAVQSGEVHRVIVYSLDRLTRRLFHLHTLLETLERAEVELVVATDPHFGNTAISRLMTNIVGAASEFQQDLNRERMADMRAALKSQGKRVAGRVPFGYRADPRTKKLVVHPEQSCIVRDFFELAAKGARPSDLANLANLNRWKDHNGNEGKWTARRITKLLRNPIYVGEIRWRDSTLPGEHEQIVKRQLFDAVQRQVMDRRTRTTRPGERKDQSNPYSAHLLGLLVCGQCDRPMSTSVSHRGPIRYIYYRCRSQAGGRPPCRGVNVAAYELERFVCGVLMDVDDAESEILRPVQEYWRQLDEREQQIELPKVVHGVIYRHEVGEIVVKLKDDLEEALATDHSDTTDDG